VGHIDEALALAREEIISPPLHFQFVLGVPGGIGAREDTLRFMAAQLPAGSTWGVAAVGRFQKPMTEAALKLGHRRIAPYQALGNPDFHLRRRLRLG
jgi:3-keto-5-aminohexanoate cleavage enzyme